jgi:flagellar basal body-associated protein FliL
MTRPTKVPPLAARVWLVLAVVAGLAGLTWASSAPKAEAPASGHGAAAPAAAAAPPFRLGRPLNGFFDMTTLRAGARVSPFRVTLPQVQTSLASRGGADVRVRMTVVVEFGNASGAAELQLAGNEFISECQSVAHEFDPRRLLAVDGKLTLKLALAEAIDRRLRTAQVRQIYFTEFTVESLG